MLCTGLALSVRAQTCELYPIALPATAISNAIAGTTVLDVFNGSAPGNFGWLAWGGSPSEPALATSLIAPGNSSAYINPTDPTDHQLSAGDWVSSKPGVSNSKKVRDALDALMHRDVTLPVWSATRGAGEKAEYFITGFARVRLLSYQLPGQNRISARFLGWATCGDQNRAPLVNAGQDQTITLPATALLSGAVSDDELPAGTLSVTWSVANGTGNVTFTHVHTQVTVASFDAPGVYVLRLTASDGALTNSDQVVVTVNRENHAPVALSQSTTNLEDQVQAIILQGEDADGDSLTYAVVSPPAYGQLTGTPPNLSYTPTADYNGEDRFTFKVLDGALESAIVTNFIHILPVNDPPVADAQTVIGAEDGTMTVALSGSDVEGSQLTFTILTPPTNGVLVVLPGTNTYAYTPGTNFSGSDSFSFIASDGEITSSPGAISIVVAAVNDAPDVIAGEDQTISLPANPVALSGQVNDDNFSGLGDILIRWSKVNGPGTVTFANATNENTTASFDAPGIYVLRLTADDGFFVSWDELVMTVNAPPVVRAGPELTNNFPASVGLAGYVSDDALPTNGLLTTSWSKLNGPGTVIFDDPSGTNTTATFSQGGLYELRLTATDGLVATHDDVRVVINLAPLVDAGSDQTNSALQATLTATANDDGLPQGSSLATAWTKASGPGDVVFAAATNLATTVTFSSSGVYALSFAATDGLATNTDEVVIVANAAPVVSAGPDLRPTVGDEVLLHGAITDDGLPPGAGLTATWSVTSGIGLMEFEQPDQTITTARFNEIGTYVVRLTVSDSLTNSYDEATITVLPVNRAPVVTAGPRQLVMHPATATLAATVTDDGLPENAVVSVVWSQISGPGIASFTNPTSTNTTASFSTVGDYVLRVTASDTALAGFADVRIAVRTPAMNLAPVANAGGDLVVGLTNLATLTGTISDDGLPQGATVGGTWSAVSGPGVVTFSQPAGSGGQITTTAAFSALGTYVLRLTATDSALSHSDDVAVTVYPFNQPPVVNAGPDQTVVLPNPELLYPNRYGVTNVNVSLSRSLLAVERWNNSIGQPGLTGNPKGSALRTARNGLDTDAGNFIVAGGFTDANGVFAKSLARFDGTTWSAFYDPRPIPLQGGLQGTNIGYLVSECGTAQFCTENFDCAAVRGSEVFVGGLFKELAPVTDGSKDLTARWSGTGWESWGFKQAGNSIYDIKATPDKIYVAGHFAFQPTNATALTLTNLPWSYGIAAWDGTNWAALGSGTIDIRDTPHPTVPGLNLYRHYVTSVAVATNGDVFIAGDFLMPTPSGIASNVAMWNTIQWRPLGSGIRRPSNNGVHFTGMALADNGDLFVGGDITNAGGYAVRNIARWDGTRWWPLGDGPINGVNNNVEAIVIHERDVYVGGSFSEAGGFTSWRLAKWNGQFWTALGHSSSNGTLGTVLSLAADDTGLYVGGQFTEVGRVSANNLAKWEFSTPPVKVVELRGLITDDGLPTGGALTRQWIKVSGPGDVKFADPLAAITTAAFSHAGTYVLRLTANDSDLTGLDEVSVTIRANQPPTVSAGQEQVIGLDEPLVLNGFVADDGLPEGAPVHHVWQQIYGPGTVTFDHPANTNVTARFSQQGTYVLRLSANDSQFTTLDEVTVIVRPRNQPPSIFPGSPVSVALDNSHTLNATVTDDGNPTNGAVAVIWTLFSGPSQVTFNDASLIQPTVNFSTNGTYVLRITATDSELTATGHTTITVILPANNRPVVNAGPDQTISNLFTWLQGSVADDGKPPASALDVSWSYSGASGAVVFANSNSPTTAVAFSQPGTYVLTLSAKDGPFNATDSVVITIPNQPPLIVNAGPDRTITQPTNSLLLAGYVLDTGSFAVAWVRLSGPGSMGIVGGTTLTPTVTFTTAGTNVIRLRVTDGGINYDDTLTVVVAPSGNSGPIVSAGSNRVTFLPTNSITLNGTVTDDGLPARSTLSYFWSQAAGPATAIFDQPATLNPEVTLPETGTYLLRLTATDGSLTNADDVVVTLRQFVNAPPQVAAGLDATVRITNSPSLTGLVTDDALPTNGILSATWRKLSGPGVVALSPLSASALATNSLRVDSSVSFSWPGTYVLRLQADDSEFTAFDDLTVSVLAADDNQAPIVDAGLDASTVAYGPFVLTGSVSDDGLPAGVVKTMWSVLSGPARVYFSDTTTLMPYAQFTAAGTYRLRLVATDSRLSAVDDVTITVSAPTNLPPFVFAGTPQEITRPEPAILQGVILDDGLPIGYPVNLSWSKASGPGSVTFVPNANDPVALAYFSAPGEYTLRLEANDSEFFVMSEVNVTVFPGTNAPPYVNAGPDFIAALSESTPLATTVSDDGLEEGLLQVSWSAVAGPGTVIFSTLNTGYRATFSAEGEYRLRLTAHDGSLTNSDEVVVTVVDAGPPVAEIFSPVDGGIVTAPTAISGTASSPILHSYVVEYRLAGSYPLSAPGGEGQGEVAWTILSTGTTSITSNTLAAFDPTLLLNGLYELRITATDTIGRTATTDPVTVIVDRNLKIGHFTISFNDLAIRVPGLPLQITRTYDSRAAAAGIQGDFGIGWTLDIKNVRLQKNRPLGRDWEQSVTGSPFDLSLVYHLNGGKKRIVTITFPDGRVEKFQFVPNPVDQPLLPIDYPQWRFVPLGNTRGALAPATVDELDGNFLISIGSVPGPVNLYDLNYFFDHPLAEEDELNRYPTLFRYTTPEGYRYLIDELTGLQSVTDPNNNTLIVSTNGLTWTNSLAGTNSLSISFQRDHLGRITNIVDALGHGMSYGYASNGNLLTFTDRLGHTNGFAYTNAAFPHHLTAIADANGVSPMSSEYDGAGRMVRNTDAYGNVIQYSHDIPNLTTSVIDRNGNSLTQEFDEDGNLVRAVDALGGETTCTYDEDGRRLSRTNPLGETEQYIYTATNGALVAVVNALGQTNTFTYDGNGQVTRATERDGTPLWTQYDSQNNVTRIVDAISNVTVYAYNSAGKAIYSRDALGNEVHSTYDPFGNLSRSTNELGSVAEFVYDGNNRITAQVMTRTVDGISQRLTNAWIYDALGRATIAIAPDGSRHETIYDESGRIAATIDELGRGVTNRYDLLGRLVQVIYADGTTEGYAYDAGDRKVATTNRLEQVTRYVFDALDRPIATILPDGTGPTNYYNAGSRLIVTTDGRGHSTWFGHDALGRVIVTTNALGQVSTFAYDARGNQITSTDALGRTTTNVFDLANRLVAVHFPDGSLSSTAYDILGRKISETDQATNTTRFGYDVLGRLTSVTNALGHVTRYEYNELGEQTAQFDAEGRVTRYAYDERGRRASRILPLGQADLATYDALGNMSSYRDFNGNVTTYQYDRLNRLTQKIPDSRLGELPVSYGYNLLGQRTNMVDTSGVTTYRYDDRSRLIEKTTPQGTLTYSYDNNGNVLSIRSSNTNGAAVTYEYDALNRLSAVSDAKLGRTAYTYDAVGNLRGYTYPNLVHIEHRYDILNRLTNISASKLLSPLASYTYALGPTGLRTSVADTSGRVVNYAYDLLYRLTSESVSGSPSAGAATYTYDAVGNRLARNSSLPGILAANYGYNANDRLTSDLYDPNGNTRTATMRDPVTGVFQPVNDQYDFENRLTDRNNGQIRVVYDGDGNRVRKTVTSTTNVVTTSYLVDDLNPTGYPQVMEELTTVTANPLLVTPTVTRVYVWGHSLISQDRLSGTMWTESYYGYDGQNSVRYLIDANGLITDTYDYDAFGNLLNRTGNTPNNYLYQGEQYDEDLKLYYLRARYADSDRGRFWTMDSFEGFGSDPASLHKYTICHNNPINMRDSSGRSPLIESLHTVVLAPMARFALQTLQRSFTQCNMMTAAMGALQGATVGGALGGTIASVIQLFTGEFNAAEIGEAATDGAFWGGAEGFFLGLNPAIFMAYSGFQAVQAAFQFWKSLHDPNKPLWVKHMEGTSLLTSMAFLSPNLATKLNNLLQKFCFPAGTEIATAEGQKPIEEIEAGDLVWAQNDETGEIMIKRVRHVFVNVAAALVVLTAGTNTLEATPEHPLWVADQGWKAAGQVQVGDELWSRNGKRAKVTAVGHRSGQFTVFNFEVEHFHSYFVGKDGILGHNACDRWQFFQNKVANLYAGMKSGPVRWIDGEGNLHIADNVALINGRRTAIEAKLVQGSWDKSLRNPDSQPGQMFFGVEEQQKMLNQAKAYSAEFDEVIYHSNSQRLIDHYDSVFKSNGINKVKWILTHE